MERYSQAPKGSGFRELRLKACPDIASFLIHPFNEQSLTMAFPGILPIILDTGGLDVLCPNTSGHNSSQNMLPSLDFISELQPELPALSMPPWLPEIWQKEDYTLRR